MSAATPPELSSAKVRDIRPFVARPLRSRGLWAFAAVMILGGGVLFAALESHRSAISVPAIGPTSDEAGDAADIVTSVTPLTIPPGYMPQAAVLPASIAPVASPVSLSPAAQNMPPAQAAQVPAALSKSQSLPSSNLDLSSGDTDPGRPPSSTTSRPQLVYDGSRDIARNRQKTMEGNSSEPGEKEERVEANHFANPSTTVPKGTIIQAVLETALDSTRAGFARAVVSRDIYGFDGKKILIAKGSRIIGEYKADLAAGQRRALIQWKRLMRPDDVIIALDSPSADPLGRAGVKGKVNSHFFEQFGGAILQSALDVGTQIAANEATKGAVVYAVPLLTQSRPPVQQDRVVPTLKIRQGTSISVFVAKDLDFNSVE